MGRASGPGAILHLKAEVPGPHLRRLAQRCGVEAKWKLDPICKREARVYDRAVGPGVPRSRASKGGT